MKKKVFSLMMTLVLAFMGVVQVQAQSRAEVTFDFEDGAIPAEWDNSVSSYPWTIWSSNPHAGTYCMASSNHNVSSSESYIEATVEFVEDGTVSFYSRISSESVSWDYGRFFIDGSQMLSEGGTSPNSWTLRTYNVTAGTHTLRWYYRKDSSVNSGEDRYYIDDITFTGVAGGAGGEDKLHVMYMAGEEEIIDSLNLGVRPMNAWTEPFEFTMYSEGPDYTVTVLDFTPSDGMFTVEGEGLPFQVTRTQGVDLTMGTNAQQAGLIERQFVAITEGDRAAHVWPVVVEVYDPAIPDVVEKAYDLGVVNPGFSYEGIPSQITPTELHDDYNMPFTDEPYNIPDGVDAVYKLTVTQDVILNAYVDTLAENGKVALYTEDFNGEDGPMAHNYYQGITIGEGGSAAGFEAMIGDATTTTSSTYFPFHSLWNYSLAENLYLASELNEAGVTTAPMTSLSWYVLSTSCTTPQNNINIWMANVSDAQLTATSHTTAGMTLVYSGSNVLPVANQWNEFVFNQNSFAWDGHSNILVLCQRQNGSYQGSISWQTHNPGFTAMSYAYTDNAPGYDATTQTYSMYTSSTNRANVILKSAGGRNRELVQIGNGTSSTNNLVFNSSTSWRYGHAQNLYTAAEINAAGGHAGYINEVSFQMNRDYTLEFDGVRVFLTATDATEYTVNQGFALESSQTENYTGNLSVNGSGWYTITLDEPFYYDGTSSILVTTLSHLVSASGSSYTQGWAYGDIGVYRGFYSENMSSALNPYAPVNGSFGGRTTRRANIQFGFGSAPVPPTPTPTPGGDVNISAGPIIEDLPLTPGVYYLVASATQADYTVYINVDPMPCPAIEGFVWGETPANDEDEVEPASVTLRWNVPPFATGWRLIFGSTYWPEANHPQTVMYPEDGSFTTDLANSYTVRNLWNNTNYFWRVEFNNDGCPEGVSSPVFGFTTHLNIPQNLTAVDYTVFDDEQIVLNWNAVQDRTYRYYNVYRDGELIGHTDVNDINNTTYTDGPLAYNMAGYTYYVTAVYDEGESAPSDPVTVKVSGYGDVNGHVYEQDGTTGIAGATVTMVGHDEFNVAHTYNFTTNSQGYYSGHIYAGVYNGSASCNGYQTIDAPVQGNPINMVYNQTTSPIDYMLDENFDPVCTVIAEYYPDSLDPNSPYVKVYWGCGLPGEEIIEPFETGDFSLFDWQVDPTYPWSITTNNPYEGQYCMMSGGAGVANVVSNMTVTVEIPADGEMSFFGKISCEQNWDYGYFFIDGQQMGQYTGAGSWGERKFDITAGTHTFQWRYTKDGSVNSNDDRFYVDYISFYKRPEPLGAGWHTFLEGEFNDALRSNLSDQPSFAYHYPANLTTQYNGFTLTKVSMFSDDLYGAVGGNYTCYIYEGGSTPGAGTLVSTLPVTLPVGLGEWVDWDLTTPVPVHGGTDLWVVWHVDQAGGMGYPAGMCNADSNPNGDWWDGGEGWSNYGGGVWTMRNYFDNRSGRGFYDYAGENAPVAIAANSPIKSYLRTYVKGDNTVTTESINPNAPSKPLVMDNNNTRSLDHYRVYRTNCYNDGPYTEENTVLLATNWPGDTVYMDVEWSDLPAGVYKWGVGCVYAGNRDLQLPRESEIVWSNCLDKDMYLDHVSVNVLMNSADSPEGTEVTFTNLNEYEQQTYGGYNVTLDGSGYYLWDNFRKGEYAVKVEHVGYEPIADTVSIWETTDLRYVMIEIIYGVENVYVSRTGWAMWDPLDPQAGGSGINPTPGPGGNYATSFTEDFEGGLSNWTIVDADGDGHVWNHSSQSQTYSCYDYTGWGHNTSNGFAYSQSYTDCTYDSYDPNNFMITNTKYSIVSGSTLNFWADYGNDSYPDHFGVAVATVDNPTPADFTMVWEGSAKAGNAKATERHDAYRANNWRSHSVDLSAYAGQDVYIAFRHFNSYDQYEVYIDDVELTAGAKNGGERHLEHYKVMCTSIDGVPIFNHNTVYPFCQLSTNEPYNAPLVEGEHYLCKVAVMYSTGLSAWSEPVEWVYEPCDHWGPVDAVEVNTTGEGNHIEWVFEHGFNPYGGDTPGPQPGQATTFNVGFEEGMPEGWTKIDANNDGNKWEMTSDIPTAWPYYASLQLDWYRTGTNAICSGSYINGVGAITPDDYLVTPQVTLAAGSTFSFWAAATDASYPAEHFGVFVSDNGTSDWTMVNEWTLTAKSGSKAGDLRASRDGNGNRLGNWHQYSVDLSAFAGQKYIAIRHFNCNDQYIMCVDDIELTAGAKSYNAVASGMVGTSYAFNITDIANYDERVIFLHNLSNDVRFDVVNGEAAGMFIISAAAGYEDIDLEEAVNEFVSETANQFSMMDKVQAAETANAYKGEMPATFVNSLMMDLYIQSRENNMCEFADPFCTDNGMYEFPAGVNAGSGEAGPDYDCLYTQPNPAWYYMRIGDPGAMDIHMFSTPEVDIDFCCWGPFEDPTTPCPNGLTEDKVVSCSYSTSWTEHCMIPATAQTGEYYILVITNYSNQPCNINFSMVAGAGSTDCGILPPTDIIGFLITMDGEYLAFAEPTDRDFMHEGEFGDHEYCVRPIYPGEMTLPDHNYGWSMGCPVCASPSGDFCAPVTNLIGEYRNIEGMEGLYIDWEEPEGAVSFVLYLDGEQTAELNPGDHPIFIALPNGFPAFTMNVGVVAVHEDCVSEMEQVDIFYDDVKENGDNVALYPNPTNGNVTIEAAGMTRITVVSVLGQVVYDVELKADTYTMNMGQFNAGMYMVRVYTENGMVVKRVTVMQ